MGGAPQYLLDKIDRVQRRAVDAGVIQGFVSINDLVRKEDEKLYRIISRDGNHILSSIIPSRSEYSEAKLRARNPVGNYLMKENICGISLTGS